MKTRSLPKNRLTKILALILPVAALAAHQALANTANWIGVLNTSADTNWSDTANWNNVGTGGSGPNGNDVLFSSVGATSSPYIITSVVDQNGLNPFSMSFTNNSGFDHTILIPAGVMVTDATTLNVGETAAAVGITPGQTCDVTIEGGGSLTVVGNVNVNGPNQTTSTTALTLDMSMLNGFTNNLTSGTMSLGAGGEYSPTLCLASNTFINVATFNLETTGGNNGRTGVVNLGATTNTIWANSINIGTGKASSATIQYTNTTGTVAIAGTNGQARATILIGDGTSGSAVNHGYLLLTNGNVANVLAGTLTMGANGGSDSGTGDSGVVAFEAGTFDVTTILMGVSTSSHDADASSGTFTAGGSTVPNAGTLIVNSPTGPGTGNIVLGDTTTTGNTGAGTLNINTNFTADIYCSITKANASQNTATVNVSGGTLVLEYPTNTIGTTAIPVDNLGLTNAVLTFNVGAAPNAVVTSLTTSGNGDVINIASVPVITSYPRQFPLIQYTGSINGGGYDFTLGSVPASATPYQGYISNNTTSVDLVLTNGPTPSGVDVWNGSISTNWDLTTLNWTNSGQPIAFSTGDAVQFDDTALSTSTNVNLTAALSPSSIVVSNSVLPYSFTGPGSLTGITPLTKYGSSSLLFANSGANSFSGLLTINAGTVQFGTNSASGNFPAVNGVTNNGSLVLDLANNTTIAAGVSGTGSLTQIGNGVLSLSASNSYTGQTTVSGHGSLMIDSYLGGGGLLTNGPGTTIGGNGTNLGPMNLGGNINPGDQYGIGTFTAGDGLNLYPGATATFDLTNNNTQTGGGINDLLQVNGNLNVNNNTIAINVEGVPQSGTAYGVITYSGTLTGSFNPTVAGTHYAASVDSVSTPGLVNVDITGSTGANLKWDSTTSSSWDNGVSQNWFNSGNDTPDYFYSGDNVLFDDSVPGEVTNIVIPTAITVYPSTISVVASANNYTISGGPIGGTASLSKDGTSTLTISNANSFSGTVTVLNGTLKTANGAALGTGGAVTVNSGATLDVDGQNLGSVIVTTSGTGVGGNGAIVNSGAQQTQALRNVTLAADTTFGGMGRWDIRGGSATLQTEGTPVNITKIGTNQISLVACTCNDGNLENVNILQGIFAIQTSSTQYGDPNGFITISTNAILDFYALTAGLTKNIVLLDGGAIYSENGSTTINGNLELTNNAANTGPGTGILTNNSGTTLIVNSVIGGPGNLLKTGSGATQLGGVNTNSGATTINAGTLTLLGSGSLANSTPITVAAGATFDVSAFGPWSLSTGQTLQGSGTVNGGVTSITGSTIAPGTPTAVGVLTIAGSVSLGGTTTMKLTQSPTATNDVLLVNNSGTLTLGGTLNITILGGSLAPNDTFTLFNVPGGISGTFTATNLPSPGPDLGWDTSNLGNGVLKVIATSQPTPHITSVHVSGATLTLTATNGLPGQQFILLETTNLVTPINQWKPVATNFFDGNGNLNLSTNIVNPAIPQEFYLLTY